MTSDPFGVCLEPICDDEEEPTPELPSTIDMMKGLFTSGKAIIGGVMANEGLLVTEEIHQHRLSICTACPAYIPDKKRCSKCGCFMEKKTMFKKTECPLGKWPLEN